MPLTLGLIGSRREVHTRQILKDSLATLIDAVSYAHRFLPLPPFACWGTGRAWPKSWM